MLAIVVLGWCTMLAIVVLGWCTMPAIVVLGWCTMPAIVAAGPYKCGFGNTMAGHCGWVLQYNGWLCILWVETEYCGVGIWTEGTVEMSVFGCENELVWGQIKHSLGSQSWGAWRGCRNGECVVDVFPYSPPYPVPEVIPADPTSNPPPSQPPISPYPPTECIPLRVMVIPRVVQNDPLPQIPDDTKSTTRRRTNTRRRTTNRRRGRRSHRTKSRGGTTTGTVTLPTIALDDNNMPPAIVITEDELANFPPNDPCLESEQQHTHTAHTL